MLGTAAKQGRPLPERHDRQTMAQCGTATTAAGPAGSKDRPSTEPQRRAQPAPRPAVRRSVRCRRKPSTGSRRAASAPTLWPGPAWLEQPWIPAKGAAADCIAFPYRWKRRGREREIPHPRQGVRQVKDGAKVFYLADLVDPEHGDRIVITEGEIDALSLLEVGVLNAVSVPDGAPEKVKDGARSTRLKTESSHTSGPAASCSTATRRSCSLPTPMRPAGRSLRNWRVASGGSAAGWWHGRGMQGRQRCSGQARRRGARRLHRGGAPYPVKSLYTADAFTDRVLSLYRHGRERGRSTGWAWAGRALHGCTGQLTVVTGVPNSGKSEWLDALAVNLVERDGWRVRPLLLREPAGRAHREAGGKADKGTPFGMALERAWAKAIWLKASNGWASISTSSAPTTKPRRLTGFSRLPQRPSFATASAAWSSILTTKSSTSAPRVGQKPNTSHSFSGQ